MASAEKEALRAQLKLQRQAMKDSEADDFSRRVVQTAMSLIPWAAIQSIHIYQPLRTHREVDTQILISEIQKNHPTVRIASWRKNDAQHEAHWLDDGSQASSSLFDVIIVPLLGFSDERHRLGFGGGFYDRFLKSQPQAITIGLCYEAGHTNFIAEQHDVPLNYIVTEESVYDSSS